MELAYALLERVADMCIESPSKTLRVGNHWEQELETCEHILCIEQQTPRQIESQDLGHCAKCELKEMSQYFCDLNGPRENSNTRVVCQEFVRSFRRYVDHQLSLRKSRYAELDGMLT